MNVALLGAVGGIGQALALLLKIQLPTKSVLALYDITPVTPGIAVDLSHIPTAVSVTGYAGPDPTPHLTLALEAGYRVGMSPISAELIESILSRQIDDLEPTLTRHGYHIKDLVEQFDTKSSEIKALFKNKLDPLRTTELREKMLAAGLPL